MDTGIVLREHDEVADLLMPLEVLDLAGSCLSSGAFGGESAQVATLAGTRIFSGASRSRNLPSASLRIIADPPLPPADGDRNHNVARKLQFLVPSELFGDQLPGRRRLFFLLCR